MQGLTLAADNRSSRRPAPGLRLLPGLLLAFALAAAAFELRNLLGITALSPLIIAIVLGMAFHNAVGTALAFKPGVAFSMRRILRFVIVLLGLQLSFAQLVKVGTVSLAIIVVTFGYDPRRGYRRLFAADGADEEGTLTSATLWCVPLPHRERPAVGRLLPWRCGLERH